MSKNYSNKKTPQVSEIQLKKLCPVDNSLSPNTPSIEFFIMFCDGDLNDAIVYQSNLYNTQRSINGYQLSTNKQSSSEKSVRSVKPVSKAEINFFGGIILYVGVCKYPNRHMYSGQNTYVPFISEAVNHNCFEQILSILHFNDNSKNKPPPDPAFNKLFKIQSLIDHFWKVFSQSVIPETEQAIDEMMIPFKWQHGCKQYIPEKPSKWGYKLWCWAGIASYVYDFKVVGSQDAKWPPPGINIEHIFGQTENVVLCLSNGLEDGQHKLFFDNIFSSPELLEFLKQKSNNQLQHWEQIVTVVALHQLKKS